MGLFDIFKSAKEEPPRKESSGVFVPTTAGFRALESTPGNGSFNSVSEHLGYHTDQTKTYLGDHDPSADIYGVILEAFSRNIVAVCTKTTITTLDPKAVRHYLRNADDRELLDSYDVNSRLTAGIANKSLTAEFLGKVLGMKNIEPNGVFYADKLGMYLHFSGGLLIDFQASDGLNHWAKHWKQVNPNVIEAFKEEAEAYWGNNHTQVLNEINLQSDALADLPQTMKNEYLPLHERSNGLHNYYMLLVCHYGKSMSLPEFKTINHGRYQQLTEQDEDGFQLFRAGRFTYEFAEDGTLVRWFLN